MSLKEQLAALIADKLKVEVGKQLQIAARLGTNQTLVSQLKRGKSNASLDLLVEIGERLGVRVAFSFEECDRKHVDGSQAAEIAAGIVMGPDPLEFMG